MNENITKILEAYRADNKALEDINATLKAAGANFHLDPDKNPGGGWTKAEMTEGFVPGEAATPKPDKPDMGRCVALAGQTVIQETKGGRYAVSYDEDGYAVKAVRQ